MSDDLLARLLESDAADEEIGVNLAKEDLILKPLLNEINMIEERSIKSFVRAMLLQVDDFWSIPSSFTGKYHPPDESLTAGNVLHTKRVVRVMSVICESYQRLPLERDVLIAAAILHDLTKGKKGEDGTMHTDPMHPYTVEYVYTQRLKVERQDAMGEIMGGHSLVSMCDEEIVEHIFRLVRCHLGPWSPVPETHPMTPMEWALHLADMIASHLHVIVDDEDDVKPWRWLLISPPQLDGDVDIVSTDE